MSDQNSQQGRGNLRRRRLGQRPKDGNQNQGGSQQRQQPNQDRPQKQAQQGTGGSPSGQQRGNRNRRNRRGQQNRQGQNQPNQRGNPQNQRGPNRQAGQRQRTQPPPPPFIQRDLLLVPQKSDITGIQKLRTQFDPLHSKVPPHITLVFPKTKDVLNSEVIKKMDLKSLPQLGQVLFNRIIIKDEKYLWLIPDSDGAQKIMTWHEEFQKLLNPPTPDSEALTDGEAETEEEIDDEKDEMVRKALADLTPQSMTPDRDFDEDSIPFEPHITLGYVPKSKSEDDVMKITQEAVSLPVSLTFDTLLLEEFGENQISVPVETIKIN